MWGSKTKIRSQFIVAFVAAAESLQLPIVPSHLSSVFLVEDKRKPRNEERQARREAVDGSNLFDASKEDVNHLYQG